MTINEQALAFVRELFHRFFELRQLKSLGEAFSDDISWIGTGKQELCSGFDDAAALLEAELRSWNGCFTILTYSAHCTVLGDAHCVVFGEATLRETGLRTLVTDIDCRFSGVCHLTAAGMQMVHVHLSVPNAGQAEGEFVPRLVVPGYDRNLETELITRNRMLQEQALVMRTLMENIPDGVALCKMDDAQTFIYVNDGFCRLTGYSHDELVTMANNSYVALIAKERRRAVLAECRRQIDENNEFELEYPLQRRDGSRIWIHNRGCVTADALGERHIHAVLTDITSKKLVEDDLRQQNHALTLHKQQLFEANISLNTVEITDLRLAHTLGLPSFSTYDDLVSYIAGSLALSHSREDVEQFLSADTILQAMADGQVQQIHTFQLEGRWKLAEITSVQDELHGHIRIRCYLQDINDEKKAQERLASEHHISEHILATSSVVYEVNLTQDRVLRGFKNWGERFGIANTGRYAEMIIDFARCCVHPDDADRFLQVFRLNNIISAYENDNTTLYLEYRRKQLDSNSVWVSCTVHIFHDESSSDLRCLGYIQDIHEEKLAQLELIYSAEHDRLTGLYNKAKVEQLVDDFLAGDGKNGQHAFFIFDLDHFKNINDSLGHAFGDAVLSRAAASVTTLFDDCDLLGRIGGDEFVILMKNVGSPQQAEHKANETCSRLYDMYRKQGVPVPVSISVGVACYPQHGHCFQTLYKKSDAALYTAKKNGRNCAMLFDETMVAVPECPHGFDADELLVPATFEHNISEYIFRILYETVDKTVAIGAVLELVGKHFNVSRAYVFEEDDSGVSTSNTFEWCSTDIAPQRENLQQIPYSHLEDYPLNFSDSGIFYLTDVASFKPQVRNMLESQNIHAMLQFVILRSGSFYGFVGYDFCEGATLPRKGEMTALRNISNMLGVFLAEMRALEASEKMSNVALSIVDALDTYAYIIDPSTYRLRFVNQKTRVLAPSTIPGDYCYRALQNRDKPCENCPMAQLDSAPNTRVSVRFNNFYLKKRTYATASWLNWTDGSRTCLMYCVELPPQEN